MRGRQACRAELITAGGPGSYGNGAGDLRLDAERGGNLARFKQFREARDPRRGLFEPYPERRKPRRHKEKALRRFRQRARNR